MHLVKPEINGTIDCGGHDFNINNLKNYNFGYLIYEYLHKDISWLSSEKPYLQLDSHLLYVQNVVRWPPVHGLQNIIKSELVEEYDKENNRLLCMRCINVVFTKLRHRKIPNNIWYYSITHLAIFTPTLSLYIKY